jgi:hypothetical protein
MEPPQRCASDKMPRRALKLVVFCNAAGGVFIKETTGTAYDGFTAQKTYKTKQRKASVDAAGMTGEEYMDAVRSAWEHFMKVPRFRRVRAGAMLVHDKCRAHTCAHVSGGLKSMGLRAVVQPPRSPDLMPLDYGIFGFSKRQLERQLTPHPKWEDRVSMYKDILSSTSPAATIKEYPLRLRACSDSRGEHLGTALSELKRKRPASER